MMAVVSAVAGGKASAVRDRLEVFAGEVLSAAMNPAGAAG